MTVKETYRLIEWFRAMGLEEHLVADLIRYMATGTDLPKSESVQDDD